MKALKIILIVVAVLVVGLLIVPLFLPSETVIERSIVVERPVEVFFDDLTNYNVYQKWNPWSEMDPQASHEITGEPGTVGHSWSWDGEEIGKGTLTIVEINPYESIHGKLTFIEPFESVMQDIWEFERDGMNTRVIWISKSEASYPIGRYFGIVMDGQLGPDLEKGLQNLKELIEKKY